MRTIRLDTLEGLPGKYLDRLRAHRDVLVATEFANSLIERDSGVSATVQLIDDYCRQMKIRAYHYTRADEASLREHGLLCRSGAEIRREFLANYGHLFTESELETMRIEWDKYYPGHQKRTRDHRIYFNTTARGLQYGSIGLPLTVYGGEQVYMPLEGHRTIAAKLRMIGSPKIVIFNVYARSVNTFTELPWGKTVLSTYHRIVNPEASVFDVDCYVTTPIQRTAIQDIRHGMDFQGI